MMVERNPRMRNWDLQATSVPNCCASPRPVPCISYLFLYSALLQITCQREACRDTVLEKIQDGKSLPWAHLPWASPLTDCPEKGGASRTQYQPQQPDPFPGHPESLHKLSGLKRAQGQPVLIFSPSKYLRLCAGRRSPDKSPLGSKYRKPSQLWLLKPACEWVQKQTVIWTRLRTHHVFLGRVHL